MANINSFDDFMDKIDKFNPKPYEFMYKLKGTIALDFIGKFENLQEDFDIICDKIEFHNNNFHIKMLQNTNITPNTTMKKLVQSLRKNTQKTLSILGMSSISLCETHDLVK